MENPTQSEYLRRVLLADAIASGATGLAMLSGAAMLAPVLGIPQELLHYAGLFLLPFAVAVGIVASRNSISRTAGWIIVGVNALWVIDSILLLMLGWISPTGWGQAFVIAQAVVVGIFAELQFIGLRRARGMAAA